jgi:hypothetical protein
MTEVLSRPPTHRVTSAQVKLDGQEVTEDDRREAILRELEDEPLLCPFCLSKFPHGRVCRKFRADGKLGLDVVCNAAAGGCGREMRLDTMRLFRKSPRAFGQFVGSHKGFFFKAHESLGKVNKDIFDDDKLHKMWLDSLRKMLPNNRALKWDDPNQPMSLFWIGFGEGNPVWAEKNRVKKAAEAYERESKGRSSEDQVDESGM